MMDTTFQLTGVAAIAVNIVLLGLAALVWAGVVAVVAIARDIWLRRF